MSRPEPILIIQPHVLKGMNPAVGKRLITQRVIKTYDPEENYYLVCWQSGTKGKRQKI